VEIDFAHSDFSFLQHVPFLLIMVLGAALLALLERRLSGERFGGSGPIAGGLAIAALIIGALLFGGSLARGGYAAWPGLVGGVICAAIGIAATRPLLHRVRARLDAQTATALPLFAEGTAIIAAALSVLAPPVGVIVLLGLLWLLYAGRGRGEQKYAGLRILR
jgi:hypothetical protein